MNPKHQRTNLRRASLLALLPLLAALLAPASASSSAAPPGLLRWLMAQSGGQVRIAYHAGTGLVRYLGADPAQPLSLPGRGLFQPDNPQAAAHRFLEVYGSLFGLKDAVTELKVMRTRSTPDGRSFVRFQQVHNRVPVMGGELIVQLDPRLDLLSANGEILPVMGISISPKLGAEAARQRAVQITAAAHALDPAGLKATQPELWMYNPVLLGGPGPRLTRLVWRTEVRASSLQPVRELVLVDAGLGTILLHFNQVDMARDRKTFTANNGTSLPGSLVCAEDDPACSAGDEHAAAAHLYAGDTYDYYLSNHGRDSIDGMGMTITSTVHYGINYQNAFWNGEQMVYGDGYGFPLADDVVGHELTHGVTQSESGLFYYFQSGAINESFSDIWGEYVDQANGHGNDAAEVKWLMGEDVSGLGAIRSLSDPPAFGNPDRMASPLYNCDPNELDNGGVHSNSGVSNKAAYLITDGGSFNGQTVTGLGLAKTTKIFYEAQANLLTSASDYADLYDALLQACTNLITAGVTQAGDCQQVSLALQAVEMDQQPTGCAAPEAPVCPANSQPSSLFFDDLENPASGNWTSAASQGENTWFYPQYPNPLGQDFTYATSGQYNLWGYDNGATGDYHIGMTTDIALPGLAGLYLRFNHAYGFQDLAQLTLDGGVVEYSMDGGNTWIDAGSLFVDNGYNGVIAPLLHNPLARREAFVAESYGYISSRLSLDTLAGQSVRFRFRIGTDLLLDDYGWFLDDIHIYRCQQELKVLLPFIAGPSVR